MPISEMHFLKGRSESFATIQCIAIGTLTFLYWFGWQRALGIGPLFDMPGGDWATNIAGAYAYLDGDWSFPIFHTDRINYPSGVNIIYTDSAPLAGLVAKIINSVAGLRWNYLGTWFFVLWVGQSAGGAFLLWHMGHRHPFALAAGSLLALFSPAFLMRFGHLALSSHFFILFALGAYFGWRRNRTSKYWFIWMAILGGALWTHAYLFGMVFPIFCASFADRVITDGRVTLAANAVKAFAIMIMLAVMLWIGGYLSTGSGPGALGYNIYNADLLSPFWPNGSTILHVTSPFDAAVAFEGYNYLGLAIIAILLITVCAGRSTVASHFWRHPFLSLAIFGMAIYSVGSVVRVAGVPFLEYYAPTDYPPYSIFRASGRFFWPAGYIIMFGCFSLLLDRFHRKSIVVLIAASVVAIQFYETRHIRGMVAIGSIGEAKPIATKLAKEADNVAFYPPMHCLTDIAKMNDTTAINSIAARYGKITDSAHTARPGGGSCEKDVKHGNTLFILASEADWKAGMPSTCIPENSVTLCSNGLPAMRGF